MNQRFFLTVFSVGAFVASAPLFGCGDFSADDEPVGGSGGDTGAGGTTDGAGGSTDGTGGAVELPPPVASCEANVVPCGGDVVGLWHVTDSCLKPTGIANVSALGIGCSEADVTGGNYEVSGNLRFDAPGDGGQLIVADTTQMTGTLELGLSPMCKDVSATLVMCEGVQGPLKSLGNFIEPTTCVDSATITDGCDCTCTVDQTSVPGFVTTDVSDVALYSMANNVLTIAGNVTVEYDYCVQGNYMQLTPKTVGDGGTVTGSIVLTRQP